MRSKVSCIVLACNSHKEKGFSVLHCLKSLVRQALEKEEYEIIIVENSQDKSRLPELESTVRDYNQRLGENFIRIIDLPDSLSRAKARNIGAKEAIHEALVFIDDDTIILDSDALAKICGYAEDYDHGYGAVRLWTKDNEFQKISTIALEEEAANTIHAISYLPEEDYLARTFIGNFGFCSKNSFLRAGGFYPFQSYGFEDDALMFFLYRNNQKVKILDDIKVTHVNHPLYRAEGSNHEQYFDLLTSHGVYWFHSLKLMYGEVSADDAIERLDPLHFDSKIMDCYASYQKLTPLDLCATDTLKYKFWKENYQYGLLDFVRKLKVLLESLNIDSFVKKSEADFDNLGPLISAAISHSIIDLDQNGNIRPSFSYNRKDASMRELGDAVVPKCEFNQFPCDVESRNRRIQLLKDRYPFSDFLRVGFIGDDDLVSASLSAQPWAWPVVIEKDNDISSKIKKSNKRAEVYTSDVQDLTNKVPRKVATFFVDPPYTLNGALGFIAGGLSITDFDGQSDREFYAILNPTMMGIRLRQLFDTLSRAGITLVEVEKNFSTYKIPENFIENSRAKDMLLSYGVDNRSITYSSSSNLYVFRARNPDVNGLLQKVNWREIYEHYTP